MLDVELWPSLPSQSSATFTVDGDAIVVHWTDQMALLTQRNAYDAIGRSAFSLFPSRYGQLLL
jgi:hypothetical protein